MKIRFGGRGSGHLQPKPSSSGGFELRLVGGRAEVAKAFCRLATALFLALPSSLLLAHTRGWAIFSPAWATAAVLQGLVTP